ncbi:MAG: hypothetical protein WDW38_006957 [Sanguina aurantia]
MHVVDSSESASSSGSSADSTSSGSPSPVGLGSGGSRLATSGNGSGYDSNGFVIPTNRHSLTDTTGKLMLKNLTLPELESWCLSVGGERKARSPALALDVRG